MVGRRGLIVSATFVAIAGCSALLDTEGFSGDAPPNVPPVEAGVTPDGSTSTDAAIDAQADANQQDAGTGGCHTTFFDDFDTPPLGATWTSFALGTPAVLSLDSALAKSPPNSLLVTVSDAGVSGAALTKSLSKAKSLCCEVDLQVDEPTGARFLYLRGMSGKYSLSMRADPKGFVNEQYDVPINGILRSDFTSFMVPSDDVFHRVLFDVVFPSGAGAGELQISVDGAPASKVPIGAAEHDLSLDTIQVGAIYAGASATAVRSYNIDNVGCSVR